MSLYYRYTLNEGSYPDNFIKSVYFANISVTITYSWPSYIEEEVNNIKEALDTRMKSQGLEDGTQMYNYLDYWLGVSLYLKDKTIQQWLEDTTQLHPADLIGKTLDDQKAWVKDELDFYEASVKMLEFYDELLVWNIGMTYHGNTINNALNLGGWVEFPDRSFSFRFASKHKTRIGKDDLPLFDIHFEVPEGGENG